MFINGIEIKNAQKIIILASNIDPKKTEIVIDNNVSKNIYYLEEYGGFFTFQ